jgi:hypothetical protein
MDPLIKAQITNQLKIAAGNILRQYDLASNLKVEVLIDKRGNCRFAGSSSSEAHKKQRLQQHAFLLVRESEADPSLDDPFVHQGQLLQLADFTGAAFTPWEAVDLETGTRAFLSTEDLCNVIHRRKVTLAAKRQEAKVKVEASPEPKKAVAKATEDEKALALASKYATWG